MGPSQSRFGYGEGSMFCVCFAYKFASCFFLGVKTTSSWFSLQHKKHLNKDNGTHMCLDFICTAGCFILTLQKTWICFRLFFTLNTMVNYHFAPPFRIAFYFFQGF